MISFEDLNKLCDYYISQGWSFGKFSEIGERRRERDSNKYTYSKRVEKEITDKYFELIQRVDKGCIKIEKKSDDFDVIDLTVVDSKGNYHLLEVKTRYEKYTKDYLLTNGLWVEEYKLKEIKRLYNKDSFVLIVVSSDDYVLETTISYDNCVKKQGYSNKTTVFDNNNCVNKNYLVSYNFKNKGDIDNFLKK